MHYRLDRTLAPREGFVNDSLITTLPAIRNRIRELRRHAARSLAESSTRQAFANAKVEIEGHCDNRGTVEYNLALGAKRAKSVKDYLVSLGIPADRLSTISYGEELPLCREDTEECWARNRRAHSVVLQ